RMRIPAPFAAALLLLTSAPALAAETPCSIACAQRFPLCETACSVNGEDTNCGAANYRCVETVGVGSEPTTSVMSTDEAPQVCREGRPDGEQPQTAEG
ncbi:hypothetical protein HRD49_20430, partial [Corallococcus exiguus]|uniref:hypothetical protein n=1 Tax=Corallococcus exiguus TaxID=83462 RepID=UPI0015616402